MHEISACRCVMNMPLQGEYDQDDQPESWVWDWAVRADG